MKVYRGLENFIPPKFPVVTTGSFDGVHCGHLEILNQVMLLAKANGGESVVVSFYPLPRTVIHPDLETKVIHTLEEKIERLEKVGIDHFVIIPFTLDFSRTTSLSFVRDILIKQLHSKILVIGYDHQFGRNREGSIIELEGYASTYGFDIEQIPAKTFEDINISSTKIRKALEAGNIDIANTYLGYKFLLTGKVVHGDKMGSQIGFPTANVDVDNPGKIIPLNGVYAVQIRVNGKCFGGMLNIGSKPTVSAKKQRTIEVHIFDFNEDLYGDEISIHFTRRIRDEKKFNSILELGAQLKLDQISAREMLEI